MVFIASTVAQRKARIYRFMQSVYRLSDTHATPCAGVAWLWDFSLGPTSCQSQAPD